MIGKQRFWAAKVAALVIALGAAPAVAELLEWPESRAMMARPDDPEAVYAFAARALDQSRPDAAAAALERLLRFRPNETRALSLLDEAYAAMAGPRERSQPLREAFIAIGGGYDDNPGAVPFGPTIRLTDPNGAEIRSPLALSRAGSAIGFVQAAATVETRVGRDGTPVFFDLSGYFEHVADLDDLDDASVSAMATAELGAASPFASAAFSAFGGEPYDLSLRVGVERRLRIGAEEVRLELSGGWNEYFSSPIAPTLDRLDGFDARLSAAVSRQWPDGAFLETSVGLFYVDAAADDERYFGGRLDAAAFLPVDLGADAPPAFVSFGGGASIHSHRSPDPTIDPGRKRRDASTFVFASTGVELDEATTAEATVSYRRRFSNLDLFRNDGLRATLRIGRWF